MTGRLVASVRVASSSQEGPGLLPRYRGVGYVQAVREVVVDWYAAEQLAFGGNVEVWEEVEQVFRFGSVVPVDAIGTGEYKVHDPQTGLTWPVEAMMIQDGKVVGTTSVDTTRDADDPSLDVHDWIGKAVAAETAEMNRALERASLAATDLNATLELVRHTALGGAGGETPYELRLVTARGTISHRKKHKETWDEAVHALGLD